MLGRVTGVASRRLGVLLVVMALAAALRSWGLLSGELVWHPDDDDDSRPAADDARRFTS